jgi:hypothetical protein
MVTVQHVCILILAAAIFWFALLPILKVIRPKTLTEWCIIIGMAAVTIGAMGCTPMTPGQREVLRRQQVPPVVYCEVRGADRQCKRITHDQVRQILNEVNR